LVNIPVKLYTATSPKRVRFHQYEAGTGRRIRYRRVAEGADSPDLSSPPVKEPASIDDWEPATSDEPEESPGIAEKDVDVDKHFADALEDAEGGGEVPWQEIVRGYEIEPGQVVTVDSDELESVAPERSRVLEVEQFVDLEDIDPIFFEKSYYVVPQRGAVTERPYWLLYRSMEDTGKVAIGRFVMRTKEYLVAVRAAEHVLVLETLFYADEVRDPKEVWVPAIEEPTERELQLARKFIDALAGDWEPARHRDSHRERLLDLLHSKAGEAVVIPRTEEEEPTVTPATDLMEILQASVDAARQARDAQDRDTG